MSKLGMTLAIGGLIILVATFVLDTRLAPIVGALLLLGGIAYGIYRNKRAGEASFRKAERATRRQHEELAEDTDMPLPTHDRKE